MKTYYLSPSGADSNSGTRKSPIRTFTKAMALLKPGDTLLLKRGVVYSSRLVVTVSGTEEYPILISSYGNGSNPRLVGNGVQIVGSWITLEKIVVSDCPRAGIEVLGKHNVITDVEASANMHGIEIAGGADSTQVLGCWLHHNTKMADNTPGPFDDYGACGVVVCGDDCEVAYNTITDNWGPSADFGTDGSAVEIYGAVGTLVHHNHAKDNRTFTELGNKRTANTVFAFNEVSSSLKDSEFLITRGEQDPNFGPVRSTSAFGNTVTMTGANSVGVVAYAGATPQVLCLYDNTLDVAGEIARIDGTIVGGNNQYRHGRVTFPLLPGDQIIN